MMPDPAQLQLTYIGHASLFLELDGVKILTDPLLRSRVAHLKRHGPKVAPSVFQKTDVVIISHLHWDHFDIPSLKFLDREINLVVPPGAAGILRKYGFRNICEMLPGERVEFGALGIRATFAQHGGKGWRGNSSGTCLGFLIGGSQRIYFPGDTDVFPGMADLAPGLDLALLPVWGWGPNLGPGHMDPWRAAEALAILQPQIAIPIHWGTYYPLGLSWFRSYLMNQPPLIFRKEASRLAPQVEVLVLQPGAALRIPIHEKAGARK